MWECEYAKEPMDYRLLWLRFVRKMWLVPISILVGILLAGVVHYYVKTAERGGRTYQAESVFYIDYAKDDQGAEYDYYNYYTWGEVIHSDFFMDAVARGMNGELSREELASDIAATVESDVRYLYVRCSSASPELSLKLAALMEEIVPSFAETREEIERIEIATAAKRTIDSTKLRIGNACFLGGCLGLFVSVLGILIALTTDAGIYLPATVEKRYHIPCLGAAFMPEFEPNWKHMAEGAGKIAMVLVDKESAVDVPDCEGREIVVCKNPVQHPEELDRIRGCEKTVLALQAGRRNNKTLERLIEQLGRQEIKPDAVMLTMADERLIRAYYRSR